MGKVGKKNGKVKVEARVRVETRRVHVKLEGLSGVITLISALQIVSPKRTRMLRKRDK